MLYRVKQFAWATGSFFKVIDEEYVKTYLNSKEFAVFNKLSHNDKHHCIRVCKDAISMVQNSDIKIDKCKVAKAALLHDIGKSEFSLNLFEKSIVVLLDRFTKGKIKKYTNVKQIDVYYNHPKLGVEILRHFEYEKDFIDTVKYHHDTENINKNNKLLHVISVCDNKN